MNMSVNVFLTSIVPSCFLAFGISAFGQQVHQVDGDRVPLAAEALQGAAIAPHDLHRTAAFRVGRFMRDLGPRAS